MGSESPNVIIYDVNGQEMSVSNGAAIPAGTSALMIAGSDGTNSRYLTIDGSGRPVVVGAGVAGTPTGGVLTIQGVSSGTAINITPSPFYNSFINADKSTFGAGVVESRHSQLSANFTNSLVLNDIATTVTGSGSTSQSNGAATISSGTSATSSVKISSNRTTIYASAREIYVYFTAAFTTPTDVNSEQRSGLYDVNNGFFVGYHGTTFGITIRNLAVDTFTSSASFNGDLLNGGASSLFVRNGTPEAIDYTKYNIYKITFGWLGGATIKYSVLSPDGNWVVFHTIGAPNLNTAPHIASPNLPVTFEITKTGSDATNLQISTSSWDAGITTSSLPDASPALQNITVQDTASTTTISANSQVIITGTPTTGSAANFALASFETVQIQVSGIWAGTLQIEVSQDSGTTWYLRNIHQTGTDSVFSSFTSNFSGALNVGAYTNCRVRATTSITGTAVVKINQSINNNLVYVGNAQRLTDGINGTVAVKPNSTAATITDPALVVTMSPNSSDVPDTQSRYVLENMLYNQSNYGDSILDVLSYIKNSVQPTLTNLNRTINTGGVVPTYGPPSQSITISLASLANAAARASTLVDNSIVLYRDAFLFFTVKTGASGTSNFGFVNIFGYGSVDGGNTFPEAITGVDGNVTLTVPPNLSLVAQINTVANATTYKLGPISFCTLYGLPYLPQKWGIVVSNQSGHALDATQSNFSVIYQGVN